MIITIGNNDINPPKLFNRSLDQFLNIRNVSRVSLHGKRLLGSDLGDESVGCALVGAVVYHDGGALGGCLEG